MPSKLLKLTSSHDLTHINHSKWRYNLGGVDPTIHDITGIMLVSAVIPNFQYNINGNNNVLRYNLNGAGVVSLVVPIGQYTTASLMAFIQANIAGTTIVQTALTYKINWVSTQTLVLYSKEDDPLSTLSPFVGVYTTLNIGAGGNADSESIPDLGGTDMFLIQSTALASHNMLSSFPGNSPQNRNVIASVPVNVVFGNNQTYEYGGTTDSMVDYPAPRNINNIDIEITDQHHNPLNLQHSSTLIFRMFYE